MKKKRLSALALTLALAAGLAVPASAAELPFSDVTDTAWYRQDVEKAYETGLIDGYNDGTFKPDNNMTYAQAVKLAACMNQKHADGAVTLENGAPVWYSTYVDYAKENRIISKDYDWSAPATRSDYADIFAHALPDEALAAKNTIADGSIPDVAGDHPQADAIYKLYRAGILEGSTVKAADGTEVAHSFQPDKNIKRSEVSAILTRMMDETARKELTLGEEVPPVEEHIHVLTKTAAREATCTERGNEAYWTCSECGKVFSDAAGTKETTVSAMRLPALGHSYRNGVCTRCGEADPTYVAPVPLPEPTPAPDPTPKPDPTPVTEPLKVVISPEDVQYEEGKSVTLTVDVTGGTTPYIFNWMATLGSEIESAEKILKDLKSDCTVSDNEITFTIPSLKENEAIIIQCEVTDAAGKKLSSGPVMVFHNQ